MSVFLDERSNIGPHHLAIGKTRKLFRSRDDLFAFYSHGYAIAVACCDAQSGAVRSQGVLDVPVGWGGGAFCVDDDGAGRVVLVFIHRDRRTFCFMEGQASSGRIAWQPWRKLFTSDDNQAAAWVSVDEVGTAWATVLERAGNFRIATITRDGKTETGALFAPGETSWYHSCVQLVPLGGGEAVAIGFRGAFPTQTELVAKMVGPGLKTGASTSVFPCDVNDRLTFHFQALGDPVRGTAHVVYLDQGLSVSHAFHANGGWHLEKDIMEFACFAPQICLDDSGTLILLAADYEGRVVESRKPLGGQWSAPVQLDGITAPNISPLFALTGYGTGGMISDVRSKDGLVPFLAANIIDDKQARATLTLHLAGKDSARSPVKMEAKKAFAEDTTAVLAQNPELILRTYKRMV